MAIAYDAVAIPSLALYTATFSWTHTPVGTPKGVAVIVVQEGSTDQVSGVTYGGVAMTRVRSDVRTATEAGRVYIYFLGASIPTGAQTVQVTLTGTADTNAVSLTVTAASDTSVNTSNGLDAGIIANPSLSISTTVKAEIFYGIFSGLAAPVTTVEAGSTHVAGKDYGTDSAMWARRSVATGGTWSIGYTAASDDVCHSALAIREGVAPQTISNAGVIASQEAFGTANIAITQFLQPSGIASGETFGSAKLILFLLPSGVGSLEAFGTQKVNLNLAPSGIITAEAFGSAKLIVYLSPSGIASSEVFGNTTVSTGAQFIQPSSITSLEAFGTPKLTLYLKPSSIATQEAFGSPKVNLNLTPSGIASAEAFGSAKLNLQIIASGIVSVEAFGTPNIAITQFLQPSGIASGETFGTAKVILFLITLGIPSAEVFGVPSITIYLAPTSIVSQEAFGSLTVIPGPVTIFPDGIVSAEALGTPYLLLYLSPSSIISQEAFGIAKLTLFLLTSGIPSGEVFGTPTLPILIVVSGIVSLEAFGTPLITIPLMLLPNGIVSAEMLGSCEVILWARITQEAFDALQQELVELKAAVKLLPGPTFSV